MNQDSSRSHSIFSIVIGIPDFQSDSHSSMRDMPLYFSGVIRPLMIFLRCFLVSSFFHCFLNVKPTPGTAQTHPLINSYPPCQTYWSDAIRDLLQSLESLLTRSSYTRSSETMPYPWMRRELRSRGGWVQYDSRRQIESGKSVRLNGRWRNSQFLGPGYFGSFCPYSGDHGSKRLRLQWARYTSREQSEVSAKVACRQSFPCYVEALIFWNISQVDLAGSERQSKTGATGDRLKVNDREFNFFPRSLKACLITLFMSLFQEATKINLSLSALGSPYFFSYN